MLDINCDLSASLLGTPRLPRLRVVGVLRAGPAPEVIRGAGVGVKSGTGVRIGREGAVTYGESVGVAYSGCRGRLGRPERDTGSENGEGDAKWAGCACVASCCRSLTGEQGERAVSRIGLK